MFQSPSLSSNLSGKEIMWSAVCILHLANGLRLFALDVSNLVLLIQEEAGEAYLYSPTKF